MMNILENIQTGLNIGPSNGPRVFADKMGFDILEVIKALATKAFGFAHHRAHRIPIDHMYHA